MERGQHYKRPNQPSIYGIVTLRVYLALNIGTTRVKSETLDGFVN